MKRFLSFLFLFLATVASTEPAKAQTYSPLSWGVNKAVTPYRMATNLNGVWYNFGTLSSSGAFRIDNMVQAINVLDYGADPTGVADSATSINAAVNAASTTGRYVSIPCGTFLIGASILVPSNTEIAGSGSCTTILMKQGMLANPQFINIANGMPNTPNNKSLFSNADFVNGNSNIYIHDMNTSLGTVSDSRVVWQHLFYKATNVRLERIYATGSVNIGSSGGVAILGQSTKVFVIDSRFEGFKAGGACVSAWDGSSEVTYDGNYCDGGNALNWGLQFNTVSSNTLVAETGSKVRITNNIVKNINVGPIDVDGLCGTACGTTDGAIIANNAVDTSGGMGIRVGHAQNVDIVGNTIQATTGAGIYIGSNTQITPVTKNVTVANNIIIDPGSNGIEVGNGSDAPNRISLNNNTITGTPSGYAILLRAGVINSSITAGPMDSGTAGLVNDGGTDTIKRGFSTESVSSATSSFPQNTTTNYASDNTASNYYLRKRRGTSATQANDSLGKFVWQSFDGSAWVNSAIMDVAPDSVSSGSAPGHWYINIAGVNSLLAYNDKVVSGAATDSTSPTTGALLTNGGLGVIKNGNFGGAVTASELRANSILISALPTCGASNQGSMRTVSNGTAWGVGTPGSAVSAAGIVTRAVICTNTAGSSTYAWAYM